MYPLDATVLTYAQMSLLCAVYGVQSPHISE